MKIELDTVGVTLMGSGTSPGDLGAEVAEPYSFTTFALPLSYAPEPVDESARSGYDHQSWWRDESELPVTPARKRMERHFLSDAKVGMFERARWFVLEERNAPVVDAAGDARVRAQSPWRSTFVAIPEDWERSRDSTQDDIAALLRAQHDRSPTDPPEHSEQFRILKLAIDRPQLVLFEFPKLHPAPSREQRDRGRLMQHGFLLVTVRFVNYTARTAYGQHRSSPRFGDVRWLNEIARCLYRTFDGQYRSHALLLSLDRVLKGERLAEISRAWPWCGELTSRPMPASPAAPDLRDEAYLGAWEELLRVPVCLSGNRSVRHYFRLFPDSWVNEARRSLWGLVDSPAQPAQDGWAVSTTSGQLPFSHHTRQRSSEAVGWFVGQDNRAFTWSCAVLGPASDGAQEDQVEWDQLKASLCTTPPEDWWQWAGFCNVDRPNEGITDKEKYLSSPQREWARASTFARWAHDGTYHGFAYHGGVTLMRPGAASNFRRAWRHQHLAQVLVQLYVRTVGHAVNLELTRKSCTLWDTADHPSVGAYDESMLVLRQTLAHVADVYGYPLLSHDQQAVELYAMTQRAFQIREVFDAIERQVHVTDDLVVGRHNMLLSRSSLSLNITAAVGLALSLAGTLLQVLPALNGSNGTQGHPVRSYVAYAALVALGFLFFVKLVNGALRRDPGSVKRLLNLDA